MTYRVVEARILPDTLKGNRGKFMVRAITNGPVLVTHGLTQGVARLRAGMAMSEGVSI